MRSVRPTLTVATLAAIVACAPACRHGAAPGSQAVSASPIMKPALVTARVVHDPDDPAIWIDHNDCSRSLVIGTDKDADGALVAFDLGGRVVKTVVGLKRPNNVDVEYGLLLGGRRVDIAVATERLGDTIRVFSLPALEPIDGGGIPVFVGESRRAPMGIALYKRPSDGAIFAVVGRKTGPTRGYLWQYRLEDDGAGHVRAVKVREFGAWSGKGYVYYSDEWVGIRKYEADPDAADADDELALFGTDGFAADREGISIHAGTDGSGYILVSDQQADRFQVFARTNPRGPPHEHPRLAVVTLSTRGSDGSEVTSTPLGSAFPAGLFVAVYYDGSFQFYSWRDISARIPSASMPGPPILERSTRNDSKGGVHVQECVAEGGGFLGLDGDRRGSPECADEQRDASRHRERCGRRRGRGSDRGGPVDDDRLHARGDDQQLGRLRAELPAGGAL